LVELASRIRTGAADARERMLAARLIERQCTRIKARYDLFRHRIHVTYGGHSHTIREGLLTDNTVSAARSLINNTYKIDCGEADTFAAIREVALDNAYDPVLDLLTEYQGKWDRMSRLDTWVVRYLGCEDTPLNRAIGRIVLIAACRRARLPGCKFDNITVLEGPEGLNKSTLIRILAGDEYFNDQSILGVSGREAQEQREGVWMHEHADLAGMRKAEVEKVKADASRQVDRARPAYGRSAKTGRGARSTGARPMMMSTCNRRPAIGDSGRSRPARSTWRLSSATASSFWAKRRAMKRLARASRSTRRFGATPARFRSNAG
jgi:hypothetical protein